MDLFTTSLRGLRVSLVSNSSSFGSASSEVFDLSADLIGDPDGALGFLDPADDTAVAGSFP